MSRFSSRLLRSQIGGYLLAWFVLLTAASALFIDCLMRFSQ